MSDEDLDTTTFGEEVESAVFNVVIDFPGQIVPRIRIFTYQDDDEGVKVPFLLYEQTEDSAAKTASDVARTWSPSQALRSQSAAQRVSEMAIGVTSAATVIYEWAMAYQDQLGEPLFPTPESISRIVINEIMAEMCYAHGIFYAGRVFDVTFSKAEEEYRPGIYL